MSPLPPKPLRSIFALIVGTASAPVRGRRFLGTGFFTTREGDFLTAGHVVDEATVADDERVWAVMLDESEIRSCAVKNLRRSRTYDVGGGRADSDGWAVPLVIANANAAANSDVITIEFSDTRSVLRADGVTEMKFRPQYRKGTVTSYYSSDYPERAPTESMDLSFPALLGASGAPVVVEDSGEVVGMIIANVERHLLPAQIERIETAQGEPVETTRYFLPTGKAVSWRHLAQFQD